jgi:hypothetical protein
LIKLVSLRSVNAGRARIGSVVSFDLAGGFPG